MTSVGLPQPRQGVRGASREQDDLLHLDARSLATRDIIIVLARHLYSAILVGDPAPSVEYMGKRILSPEIHDLVIESGALRSRDADVRAKGCGILLDTRREWACTDEEWAAHLAEDPSDDERQTVEAWYVQYGPQPEDVCRWTNCSFIAVPTELRSRWYDMAGKSDGHA